MIFLTRNIVFFLVKSNFLFTIDWSEEKPTITYVHVTWCNNQRNCNRGKHINSYQADVQSIETSLLICSAS